MNTSSSVVSRAPGSRYDWAHEYIWVGFALTLSFVIHACSKRESHFGGIPAVGGDGLLSSWLGAVRTVKNSHKMLEEGYQKYKKGVFRVPSIQRWEVLISRQEDIEEMLKAPEEALSMTEAMDDLMASHYTMGVGADPQAYHIRVVRGPLNRHLGEIYPEMHDEIVRAYEDNIPAPDEWIKVKAYEMVLKIVSRATNRLIIGPSKCRNQEYLDLNVQFARDVIFGAQVINLFPKFLKPIAGRLLTTLPGAIRGVSKHLQPIIEQRRQKIAEYGVDYPDKPNDMLSWLLESAKGEEGTLIDLTKRVLLLNFVSIHTTSMNFTRALYNLAAQPEYLEPLREEVEAVIAEEGWSKAAIGRMRKLDSFLKESMRASHIEGTISRKAVKPFTFSDGTRVPKGTFLTALSFGPTYDGHAYPREDSFDGFRFSNLGNKPSNMLVVTSPDSLTFGHGRHACPGRFFAATEIKTMMAYLLLTYDVKMENEGVRPENGQFFFTTLPNMEAEVLFRRRQT